MQSKLSCYRMAQLSGDKTMKKLMLLFCVLILVASVHAELTAETTVPDQVLAGNYFTFAVKLTNTDTTSVHDISVELDAPNDFKIRDSEKNIHNLDAGESITLQWSVKADESISAGYYNFDVLTTIDGDDSELNVPILIRSLETSLEITRVDVNPSTVEPGNVGTISLDIANHADYQLRDIHVLFNLENVPFAPREGTEERIIPVLENQDSGQAQFEFTVLPTAVPGIYKIPVTITYFDEFGKQYTKLNTVAVEVNAAPRLELFVEGNAKQGKVSTVTLRIINRGLTPVQFLTVTLANPAVTSAQNVYIGDLQVDDFQTEELSILTQEGSLSIPVTIEFSDATNKNYVQQRTLTVPVLTPEQAKELNSNSSGIWIFIVMGIVVIFAAYNGWKYLRRKKKE